jgi:chorismate mutase
MRFRHFAVLTVALALALPPSRAFADPPQLDTLVDLTVERLATADSVAAAKWGTPSPIDDPEREAQVYSAMTELGSSKGLPGEWVRSVFLGQIEANKTVQRGLHTWWGFDRAAAPAARPDLAAVRPIIDRVNAAIVDQLALHKDTLTGRDCVPQLSRSVLNAAARVDALHQAALVRAAVSLCR